MEGKDGMDASDIQNEEHVPDSREELVTASHEEHVPASYEKERTEWVIQVEERFNNEKYKDRKSSRNVRIFKVLQSIKNFKPEAYAASLLPLGPFFHSQNKTDLLPVDDHKLSAVESTLQRLNVTGKKRLVDIVVKWDEEIRDCYEDRAVECSKRTLAWIMTTGACCIIEFFYYITVQPKPHFNLIFESYYRSDMLDDILKLENQIPLLVLKRILELYGNEEALKAFALGLSKSDRFGGFPFLESGQGIEGKIMLYISNGRATHLLDLCRMLIKDFLLGSSSNSTSSFASDSKNNTHSFLSAVQLSQAGIKFEKSEDGKIRFKTTCWGSATLYLPEITVDDYTETFLRNLMALEECQMCVRGSSPRIISYYIKSVDELIESKEDVALLREGKIIDNLMGSDEEVANMFNALCKGITVEKYRPYDEIKRLVEEHHKKSKHLWIAEFKERYLSKPWLSAGVVVGGLVFVMTVVQTFS